MTPANATPWPVRGQLFNLGGTINNYGNGNPIASGLTGLSATISRDDAAPVATTNAPVEIGTNTGIFSLDLTANEMQCSKAVVIVSSTASGAMARTLVVSTLNLAWFAGRWDAESVKRFEQLLIDINVFMYGSISQTAASTVVQNPDGSSKVSGVLVQSTDSAYRGPLS